MDFLRDVLMFAGIIVGVLVASVPLAFAVGLLRLVTVQEATAVAFKYLGRCRYVAMEFAGHSFDPNGSIVAAPGPNSWGSCWCVWRIGGWVFYIYPLVQPTKYEDQNDPDNFGDGIYVRLGDRTSEPFTSEAETAPPESIGLNVQFVSTMRVSNPYRYLFVSPRDVKNQTLNRQDAVLRAWVRSGDQNHAQSARGNGAALWADLIAQGCGPVFDRVRDDWGMEILPQSIVVRDVGYDPEYQAALKAESQADLIAKASVKETAGRIIRSVAEMSGVNIDDPVEFKRFKKKLKDHPELRGKSAADGGYKEAFDYAEDQTKRDRGGVDDIRLGASDGTSLSGNLGPIGALAALFGGRGNRGNPGGKQNNPGTQGGGGKADVEKAAQNFFDKHGVWPRWDPKGRGPKKS